MTLTPRLVSYSSRHAAEIDDQPIIDIDQDPVFTQHFLAARPYTMTSKETMFALYKATEYIAKRNLPGDFVECGVWRGGSALLAALTFATLGDSARRFHLFDTYEGMTPPGDNDIDIGGVYAREYIESFSDDGKWCYANMDDVTKTFNQFNFSSPQMNFIKGDIRETIFENVPDEIAILRLDTDWYDSTKLELELLYPRLVSGGVLIIDDYGHWKGSKQAVDEYFLTHPAPLLNRVNYAVRICIKI